MNPSSLYIIIFPNDKDESLILFLTASQWFTSCTKNLSCFKPRWVVWYLLGTNDIIKAIRKKWFLIFPKGEELREGDLIKRIWRQFKIFNLGLSLLESWFNIKQEGFLELSFKKYTCSCLWCCFNATTDKNPLLTIPEPDQAYFKVAALISNLSLSVMNINHHPEQQIPYTGPCHELILLNKLSPNQNLVPRNSQI